MFCECHAPLGRGVERCQVCARPVTAQPATKGPTPASDYLIGIADHANLDCVPSRVAAGTVPQKPIIVRPSRTAPGTPV